MTNGCQATFPPPHHTRDRPPREVQVCNVHGMSAGARDCAEHPQALSHVALPTAPNGRPAQYSAQPPSHLRSLNQPVAEWGPIPSHWPTLCSSLMPALGAQGEAGTQRPMLQKEDVQTPASVQGETSVLKVPEGKGQKGAHMTGNLTFSKTKVGPLLPMPAHGEATGSAPPRGPRGHSTGFMACVK